MNKSEAHFVDCGMESNSLAHLEGETVIILADGVTQTAQEVVDGVIDDTDFADASEVHIGLSYRSELQPMKPVVNTQMGTSAASIVGTHYMGVSVHNSDEVQYGTDDGDLYYIDFDDLSFENTSEIDGLYTGIIDVNIEGGYTLDNNIRIVSDAPLPCIVRALVVDVGQTGK